MRGAEAELGAAELERDNVRVLLERDVVSPAELARAEAEVRVLQARVEEARAQAGLAEVQRDLALVAAPFDGVVNRVPLRVGSTVAEDHLLTTLTDPSEMFAWFHLSEREALEWSTLREEDRPQEVSLVLADGTVFPHVGRIDAAASELDPATRNLALRARFPNPDRVLRHGGSGKVVLRSEIRDAVFVPQRSTIDVQGNHYVYVVEQGGVPRARRIVPRARLGDDFVVSGGIGADERFVLEGVQKVRDGEPIATRDAQVLGG